MSEIKSIPTLDERVDELLDVLKYKDLDGSFKALGESVIVKRSFYVPIKSLMLSGIANIKNPNSSKDNEVGAIMESISKTSYGEITTVVSIGHAAYRTLGLDDLREGDKILLDVTSSSYGVMYLMFEDNSRCPIKVGKLLSGQGITNTLIDNVIEKGNGNILKDGAIKLNAYLKVTPLHLVCTRTNG